MQTNEMSAKIPVNPVTVVNNVVQSDYYNYDLQRLNNAIDDIHEWQNLSDLRLAYHKFFTMVVALQPNNEQLEDLKVIDYSFMINLLDDLLECFKPIKK